MRVLRFAGLVLVGAVPLVFAYGPLFPWSPVKPGYQRLALERADVFYPAGSEPAAAYRRMDAVIRDAEQFHRMPVTRRMCVVAVRNWSDFHRFLPQHQGTSVGGVTLVTGTVIYISPRIAERGLDTGEFLRHEMSHAILHQNTSILKALSMQKQSWIYEGVPVWFGRQKAYLTQAEFLDRARSAAPTCGAGCQPAGGLLIRPEAGMAAKGSDMRFNYIAWRDFIDFLDQRYGRDQFWRFMGDFRREPSRMGESFKLIYGQPFEEMVCAFEREVRSGQYEPREAE